MLQELGERTYRVEYAPLSPQSGDHLLAFREGKLWVRVDGDQLRFPRYGVDFSPKETQYLFRIDDDRFFLCARDGELPGFMIEGPDVFRRGFLPKTMNFAGVNGYQLYIWYRSNRFCGACGERMLHDGRERMVRCPRCGNTVYPRISPVIITAVTDGERLLMTRARGSRASHLALVAGFIETGETPEDALRREVFEETGVRVKNLRYYRSQPWGYSQSLLLGYFAALDGSDRIRVQEEELSEARWVPRDQIPNEFDDFSLTNEMICLFKRGGEPR